MCLSVTEISPKGHAAVLLNNSVVCLTRTDSHGGVLPELNFSSRSRTRAAAALIRFLRENKSLAICLSGLEIIGTDGEDRRVFDAHNFLIK